MCGLAGILRFDDAAIDPGRLARMQQSLACRGPDEQGTITIGPCGLAHTRLAVLDLPGGHQPMVLHTPSPFQGEGRGEGGTSGSPTPSASQRFTLTQPSPSRERAFAVVFNGEIYNHRELRQRLTKLGHAFATDHSDTEVLLHGYRQWGVDLPVYLQGMFAFAIYDGAKRELFLARDRAGKKPLFVRRSSSELLVASTVAAVLAGGGGVPALDRGALRHYLTFGYTLEPSLWHGIEEIPAASWRLVSAAGEVQQGVYWRPPPISRTGTTIDAHEAVLRLIDEAVEARLEADVPLGCFLSGGIDSSLIAALAQRRLASRGRRLKTFSVAMPDARYDESPHARRVAEHIGSEHHELRAEPHVEADLRRLVTMMGEPLGDSSLLPTYWLSRAAREHVTVALSGDGGDELFGGYDRYRALRLLSSHRWWLRHAPAGLLGGGDQKSAISRLRRLVQAARHPTVSRQYLSIIRLFSSNQMAALGFGGEDPGELFNWDAHTDVVDAARRWDLQHYLPFDLLRKVDRASMAVALEVRCPMLDTAVYDLAAHLPMHVLMPGGKAKGLLRRAAASLLPAEIVRRKKMGFAVPIGGWFAGPLAGWVRQMLLEDGAMGELGIRRRAVEKMIAEHGEGQADHSQRIFALVALAVWQQWRRGIERGESGG